MNQDKRLIEETFPVKEVSAESARERHIRRGHITNLHIWWTRKPFAASRATIYAALIPPPKDINEWSQKRDFIISLSRWENSLNTPVIERARREILESNEGVPPKVLDPFGGSGAIPVETLRLGCETYSNDLNPVAVLIQKCTLEYPAKYGGSTTELRENPLLRDVRRWAAWVLTEAEKELKKFYPTEHDGSIPVGWIWSRTVPCQNPSCGAEIPLKPQFWLAKQPRRNIALYPYIENENLEFTIVGDGYEEMPSNFNPTEGNISRAVVVCPVCSGTMEATLTRQLFQERKAGERMIAVVLHKPGTPGKRYRVTTQKDLRDFQAAEEYLSEKREKLKLEWGMDPVPNEPLPPKGTLGFRIQGYGMLKWGDLFNSRQKLALITFVEKIKAAYQKMVEEGIGPEYAKAIVSYLACTLDKMVSFSSSICTWKFTSTQVVSTFAARQALPMAWDYFELNTISGVSTSWQNSLNVVLDSFNILSNLTQSATASQSSATNLSYPDNTFDAVFTDPPYYDNVPYSYLSDFFYVWLKRTLADVYPELFSTPLTPKKNEVVAYSHLPGGFEEGKRFFEESLKLSFQEIHRVLKPNGVAVIVYAHKSTEGWETLINSLLDSGLIITGAWPLSTEMTSRLRSQESAALASSIYIVARKMKRESTGFYNEVKEEMTTHLNAKLHRLWEEGLSGADFFIAAIGSAIEVFGKYEQVMDFEGEVIRADRLLDDVREIATDYAVQQILHNGFAGEISDLTRFYVLWRWEYGEARVPFDEARKLAQSCGIDLAREWGRSSFVKKERQFISVLGPQARTFDDLTNANELIDVLHQVLLLWEGSQRDEILRVLRDSDFGDSEAFYRVAQAISETLSIESREKKLLDGFLAGRERVKEDIRQGLLF